MPHLYILHPPPPYHIFRHPYLLACRYVILPNKLPPTRFEAHLEIHAGSVDEGVDEQVRGWGGSAPVVGGRMAVEGHQKKHEASVAVAAEGIMSAVEGG